MMPAGRPVKYTPEEFTTKFEEYMEDCKNKGKLLPNIAGFAFFADFNLDTYYEYKANRPEFSESIKRIEVALEDSAINCKDPAKSIFYMKNKFGYKDKIEQEITGPNGGPIQLFALSDAELDQKLIELEAAGTE